MGPPQAHPVAEKGERLMGHLRGSPGGRKSSGGGDDGHAAAREPQTNLTSSWVCQLCHLEPCIARRSPCRSCPAPCRSSLSGRRGGGGGQLSRQRSCRRSCPCNRWC